AGDEGADRQVAAVAVREEDRAALGRPAGRGGPPGVERGAVGRGQRHVAHVQLGRRSVPLLRGGREWEEERVFQRQEHAQHPPEAVPGDRPPPGGPPPRRPPQKGTSRSSTTARASRNRERGAAFTGRLPEEDLVLKLSYGRAVGV